MNAARPRTARRRRRILRDPVMLGCIGLTMLLGGIAATSLAGASSAGSGLQLSVGVKSAIAMAPGHVDGDRSVTMPILSLAGQVANASSAGWHYTSNWDDGYDVSLRATTDPALNGQNAVDGSGAPDAFADYSTTGCPCPWNDDNFQKGTFGYSVAVQQAAGDNVQDTTKWGSDASRNYRGLSTTPYVLWHTGGRGDFDMQLFFRTGIGENATQEAGSYRANLILSVSPSM